MSSSGADSAQHGRLVSRLAGLSLETVVDLLATVCVSSATARNVADAELAKLKALPEHLVSNVLLSLDIAQHILGFLDTVHCVCRQVCTVWKRAWDAKQNRRGLRPQAEVLQPDFAMHPACCLAAFPSGDRLVVGHYSFLRVVDSRLQAARDLTAFLSQEPDTNGVSSLAASDDSVYVSFSTHDDGCAIRRIELGASTDDAESAALLYEPVINSDFEDLALAQNNTLFAAHMFCDVSTDPHSYSMHVRALDARTLQERYRFGAHFKKADWEHVTPSIVVVNEELYWSTGEPDVLWAYSFAGEPLREVRGVWRAPRLLRYVRDRLYLIDNSYTEYYDTSRVVTVLTLEGETIQVYGSWPAESRDCDRITCMCPTRDKLMLTLRKGYQNEAVHLALAGV